MLLIEMMYPKLRDFAQQLEATFPHIAPQRKEKLISLSHYLSQKQRQNLSLKLMVVCTHNSRRSHIGQLILAMGATYYQLPHLETYSAGTEATAFNPKAVEALERIGFQISSTQTSENPVYQVRWSDAVSPYDAFSKVIEATPNPKQDFGAIMVCSEADKGCPFVSGSDFRLSLPFNDPKHFDGTPQEAEKYDQCVREMGCELLFMLHHVSQ